MKTTFSGGPNIAMKVPPDQFEATCSFYRETLGLSQIEELKPDVVFQFGANRLWIDPTPDLDRSEVWLQVQSDKFEASAAQLDLLRSARADGIEPLPDGFAGFWISNPGGVIHLISKGSDS